MPELNARSHVHGEGGTEDLRESGPHTPAVVWPRISGTGRVAAPVIRGAGLELLLVGVAEVGIGLVVDVVVDADIVLVRVCRRGAGYDEVV